MHAFTFPGSFENLPGWQVVREFEERGACQGMKSFLFQTTRQQLIFLSPCLFFISDHGDYFTQFFRLKIFIDCLLEIAFVSFGISQAF